jgi:transcriptional regulator with XRE-family HTH domain
MSLGEKIKTCRKDKGYSLRLLASKVELSASFLSQIEQGKASPSIENLKKIANELDVRVSFLIEEEDEKRDTDIVKKDERNKVESIDSKTMISLLTTSHIEKHMEPILYEIEVGGESGRDYYTHNGEEFIFILEGKLEVYIEQKTYVLEEGDSLYFKSTQRHRFKNTGDVLVKALWVVTPPTF